MTNYELLRAERNRLFPEALKLEFGCEVRIDYNPVFNMVIRNTICIVTDADTRLRNGNLMLVTFDHAHLTFPAKDIKKILGKPLTIENVLMMVYRHRVAYGIPFAVYSTGYCTLGEEAYTYFNLDHPLTHPDNDEACGKVLDLISKK